MEATSINSYDKNKHTNLQYLMTGLERLDIDEIVLKVNSEQKKELDELKSVYFPNGNYKRTLISEDNVEYTTLYCYGKTIHYK